MVLTNVQVWKTFAISRDSSANIGTAMKSVRKTTITKEEKHMDNSKKAPQKTFSGKNNTDC